MQLKNPGRNIIRYSNDIRNLDNLDTELGSEEKKTYLYQHIINIISI